MTPHFCTKSPPVCPIRLPVPQKGVWLSHSPHPARQGLLGIRKTVLSTATRSFERSSATCLRYYSVVPEAARPTEGSRRRCPVGGASAGGGPQRHTVCCLCCSCAEQAEPPRCWVVLSECKFRCARSCLPLPQGASQAACMGCCRNQRGACTGRLLRGGCRGYAPLANCSPVLVW